MPTISSENSTPMTGEQAEELKTLCEQVKLPELFSKLREKTGLTT
jgi:hypothetical protein